MLLKHALQLHELYGAEWDERMIMNPKLDSCSWFMEDTMIIAHRIWDIKESNQWGEGKTKNWKHVWKMLKRMVKKFLKEMNQTYASVD
jgi:hypothetical protein